MKVLICTQTVDIHDPILGFFHAWIIEFSRHCSEVHVICLKEGSHTFPDTVHVYSLGKEKGGNRLTYLYRFFVILYRLLIREHVDIVFYHMGAVYNILGAPFFLMRKALGTKFYWWKAHGHINTMGRCALLFVDRVFTASEASFPVETKKRFVVGHGIPKNQFVRPRTDISDHVRLVVVGRIVPSKDLASSIEVGKILHERGVSFDMCVIGPVVDREYKTILDALILQYGLSEYIRFLGPVLSTKDIYTDADMLIHPSRTGSIDKVVLEAMQQGTIPITRHEAYGTLLTAYGLTVRTGAPEEYVDIIVRLQNMQENELAILQSHLHNIVEREHELGALIKKILYTV